MPFSSTLTVSQICLLSGKVQYKSICWFSAMQGQYSSELSKVHWANTQHGKKVTIQKSSTILPSSWLLFSNKKVTEGAAGRRQERPEEQSSSFNFPFCEGTEQCLKTTWAACSSVLNSACSPGQMTHPRCTQSWSSHERCLSFFCNLWHLHWCYSDHSQAYYHREYKALATSRRQITHQCCLHGRVLLFILYFNWI